MVTSSWIGKTNTLRREREREREREVGRYYRPMSGCNKLVILSDSEICAILKWSLRKHFFFTLRKKPERLKAGLHWTR